MGVFDGMAPDKVAEHLRNSGYFESDEFKDAAFPGYGGSGYGENVFERLDSGKFKPWESQFERTQLSGDMSNQELQDTQFANLLGQQGDFQNAQGYAQKIREQMASENTPTGLPEDPFSWYKPDEGGLKEVKVAQAADEAGGDPYSWNLQQGLSQGMTNSEVMNALAARGDLDPNTISLMNAHFDGEGDGSKDWWTADKFNTPELLSAAMTGSPGPEGLSDNFRAALNDISSNMFVRSDLTTPAGGGPKASPGYALPI